MVKQLRILIVEDDHNQFEIVDFFLKNEARESNMEILIERAEYFGEAIIRISNTRLPRLDAISVDMEFPLISFGKIDTCAGVQFIKYLRKVSEFPHVMFTNHKKEAVHLIFKKETFENNPPVEIFDKQYPELWVKRILEIAQSH